MILRDKFRKIIYIFLISIALIAVLYHLALIFYPYTPISYTYRINILELTQLVRATHVFFIILVGYLFDFVSGFSTITYGRARRIVSYGVPILTLWFTVLIAQDMIYNRTGGSFLLPIAIIFIAWLFSIIPPLLPQRFSSFATYSNIVPAILIFLPYLYMVLGYEELIYRGVSPLNMDVAMGWSIMLFLLGYILKHIGPEMPLLVLLFMFYDVYGYIFPPPWNQPGFSPSFLVGKAYIETEAALWGVITSVSVKYIVYFFILTGTFTALGFGEAMAKTFLSLLGRNSANVGRVATAMGVGMGIISGSGAADTAFIGSTLRDIFRRAGYDDLTAAGLTANAGTLAIITPPILGAVAFIIVELLQIPYLWVIIMSAPLTFFYAFSILMYNEFLTRRIKLRENNPVTREKIYKFHVFLPAVVIVIMILFGYSVPLAVTIATLFTIVLALFDKDMRRNIVKVPKGWAESFIDFTEIGATIVMANVIMTMVVVSGLHLKFSLVLLDLVRQNIALAIIFAAGFSILLGMGVPPTATFVLSSILTAPVIIKLAIANGIPEIATTFATYMFLFYMAMLADVTPPVALSAYAAAGVFRQDPIKTGVKAALVALPKYIYAPAMVYSYLGTSILILPVFLAGTPITQAIPMITQRFAEVTIGIVFISAGVGGFLFRELGSLARVLLTIGGVLLVIPGEITDLLGLAIVVPITIYEYIKKRSVG
ncbi:MAG: TRAP transporter permease [Sulfolobales archaeon]